MRRRAQLAAFAALAACLATVGQAFALQSTKEIEKGLSSPDPQVRQEAVRELAKCGDEGWPILLKKALRDPEARVADEAQLALGGMFTAKSVPLLLGKDGLGSGDPWVRLRVAEALGRIEAPIAAKELIRRLDERDEEVRRVLVGAIGRRASAGRVADADLEALREALGALAEKAKDPGVRAAATVAAFQASERIRSAVGGPEAARIGIELYRIELRLARADGSWQVRAAAGVCARECPPELALETFEALATDEHPGPRALAVGEVARMEPNPDGTIAGAAILVDRLAHETNQRIRLEAYDALVQLSGFKHPLAVKPWTDWLRDPRPYAQKTSDAPLGEYLGVTMTTFAGLRVRSQRVCFLIDLSGSMWTEREGGRTRKQAVDAELERALAALTEETSFNLIPYTLEPFPWRKTLTSATPQNVQAALKFFRGCTQSGKGNFWDAWLRALADPEVDSVVVLTDGAPTGGRRWNLDLMRSSIAEQNRFRRVALDAILVDAKGGLVERWKAICADNRGSVQVTEL